MGKAFNCMQRITRHKGLTMVDMGLIPIFSWVDNAGERIHSKCKWNPSMSCTTYYYTLSPSWKKLKILSQNLPFYCCSRKGTVLRSSCSRRPVPPSTENGCKFTLNLSLYHLTAVECFLVFNLISTLNMYFISVFQLAYCYINLVLALPIFQWQFSELILSCPRNGCFWEQYWLTFEFFLKSRQILV